MTVILHDNGSPVNPFCILYTVLGGTIGVRKGVLRTALKPKTTRKIKGGLVVGSSPILVVAFDDGPRYIDPSHTVLSFGDIAWAGCTVGVVLVSKLAVSGLDLVIGGGLGHA